MDHCVLAIDSFADCRVISDVPLNLLCINELSVSIELLIEE